MPQHSKVFRSKTLFKNCQNYKNKHERWLSAIVLRSYQISGRFESVPSKRFLLNILIHFKRFLKQKMKILTKKNSNKLKINLSIVQSHLSSAAWASAIGLAWIVILRIRCSTTGLWKKIRIRKCFYWIIGTTWIILKINWHMKGSNPRHQYLSKKS